MKQVKVVVETDVVCEKCNCKNGTVELHSCPYDCDIHGDHSENCNCCPTCTQDCCDDI
jgi:hypothetical protein